MGDSNCHVAAEVFTGGKQMSDPNLSLAFREVRAATDCLSTGMEAKTIKAQNGALELTRQHLIAALKLVERTLPVPPPNRTVLLS